MTLTFLLALITSVLGYTILAVSCFGWGRLTARILRCDFTGGEGLFSTIWLGWAVTLLLLQVLNLFLPINLFLSLYLAIIGALLAAAYALRDLREGKFPAWPRFYLLVPGIAILWIANQAMVAPTLFDSGLYHFSSIRWLNESVIVPGLGNLHDRLAFNSSFFAYDAYLNLYPVFNHGYNLANSFLMALLAAEFVSSIPRYFTRGEEPQGRAVPEVIELAFIPVLMFLSSSSILSGPSPDIASTTLQILIFVHFVRASAAPMPASGGDARLTFIFSMCATAVTVKLTNLPYAAAVCATLLLTRFRLRRPNPGGTLRAVLRSAALPMLIVSVWALRGILMSGCPAYPSTMGCVRTAWALPIESVGRMTDVVASWARAPAKPPERVLKSWRWLQPWFKEILDESRTTVVYPAALSALALIASLGLWIGVPAARKLNAATLLIPVPILAALGAWFTLAPNIRFAHALFWILPVACMAVVLKLLETAGMIRAGIIAAILLLLNASTAAYYVQNPRPLTRIAGRGYAPIPVASVTKRTTASGLEVWIPVGSDECWDAQLPCTPYFNPELQLTQLGAFKAFTVNGGSLQP